jgi:hypothetical protein
MIEKQALLVANAILNMQQGARDYVVNLVADFQVKFPERAPKTQRSTLRLVGRDEMPVLEQRIDETIDLSKLPSDPAVVSIKTGAPLAQRGAEYEQQVRQIYDTMPEVDYLYMMEDGRLRVIEVDLKLAPGSTL